MNIVTLLEMAADAFPDRTAIKSGGESRTYGELLHSSLTATEILRSAKAVTRCYWT